MYELLVPLTRIWWCARFLSTGEIRPRNPGYAAMAVQQLWLAWQVERSPGSFLVCVLIVIDLDHVSQAIRSNSKSLSLV